MGSPQVFGDQLLEQIHICDFVHHIYLHCLFRFCFNVNGYKRQITAVLMWFDVFSVNICTEKEFKKERQRFGLVRPLRWRWR